MANLLRDFILSDPIFTDTNIFVYHQGAHPDFGPDCREFLDRVECGDIQALTADVVINEVIYIIQIQRAANLLGTLNRSIIHQQMAGDAAIASECWSVAEHFLNLLSALQRGGLMVIDVEPRHYHLGIEHIASNDVDLDRVPFLTRWEPRQEV